jgi:hypothetical protein
LDAKAASTRDDSYLRKLLKDQASKYRTDAGERAATEAASTASHISCERVEGGRYFFPFDKEQLNDHANNRRHDRFRRF